MKVLLMLCIGIGLCLGAMNAQGNQFLAGNESDPEAVDLLNRMETALNNYQRIDIAFTTEMLYPGEAPVKYEGTLEQEGNAYKIDVGEYQIFSDGVTRWVYLTGENEVNIYNASPEEGPQTPLDHLTAYKSGDYVYAITGEEQSAGKRIAVLEFKPLDKHSDFSKIRVKIRRDSAHPVSLLIFEKGGARIEMEMLELSEPGQFADGYFIFTIEDHPGIRVEDLRID